MDARQPRAGRHYPRSTGEFQSWFATDADCLEWLRWPDGFVCPRCGHAGGWAISDGRYKCTDCGTRTSVDVLVQVERGEDCRVRVIETVRDVTARPPGGFAAATVLQ